MKDRGMTEEEKDLADTLAQAFDTAPEAQVVVYFESGYQGGIAVRLQWEGRQDGFLLPWREVARLLASHLPQDQRGIINKYRDD